MPLGDAEIRMSRTALRIEFGSERFPFDRTAEHPSSDLPFFPGEDLCAWLSEALPQWTLDYCEEDWGWLLGSDRMRTADTDSDHQICVYAYPPGSLDGDGSHSEAGEWMLVLHRRVRSRRAGWLGRFLHRWEHAAFDAALAADVLAALRGIGAQDLRASALRLDGAGNEVSTTAYTPEPGAP